MVSDRGHARRLGGRACGRTKPFVSVPSVGIVRSAGEVGVAILRSLAVQEEIYGAARPLGLETDRSTVRYRLPVY